ncbi:MAG: hypothetical protein BJ554DRAFT_7666, partial [Olpidium bornovanus]
MRLRRRDAGSPCRCTSHVIRSLSLLFALPAPPTDLPNLFPKNKRTIPCSLGYEPIGRDPVPVRSAVTHRRAARRRRRSRRRNRRVTFLPSPSSAPPSSSDRAVTRSSERGTVARAAVEGKTPAKPFARAAAEGKTVRARSSERKTATLTRATAERTCAQPLNDKEDQLSGPQLMSRSARDPSQLLVADNVFNKSCRCLGRIIVSPARYDAQELREAVDDQEQAIVAVAKVWLG